MSTCKRHVDISKQVDFYCTRQGIIAAYICSRLSNEDNFFVRASLAGEAKVAKVHGYRLEALQRILYQESLSARPSANTEGRLDKVLERLNVIVKQQHLLTAYPVSIELAVASEHFEMAQLLGHNTELNAEVVQGL
jgi:hypothetical protein